MKVSIEVGHPAHVHYWRPVREALLREGHDVTVLARAKETTHVLLREMGVPFVSIGRNFPTISGKAIGMAYNTWKVLLNSKALGIQLMLSGGMPYSAQASAILGIPHLAVIDTESAVLTLRATVPFTDIICTPACFTKAFHEGKHARFNGYVESMYLRPDYFQPRLDLLKELGLRPGQKFTVVRFSSRDSSHDFVRAKTGLESVAGKERLIRSLERHGPVFASSEVPLPPTLLARTRPVPLRDVHSLLYHASLYCGEGAKMAAESGLLGTPWLYVSPSGRSYLDDQERRFQLGRSLPNLDEAVDQADEWLEDSQTKETWRDKRQILIESTGDVTQFVLREIRGLMAGAGE